MVDILDNTYNNLVNEIFNQIRQNDGGNGLYQVEDKLHFFKLCAFMIQIQRLKAYEQHQREKKDALKKAREQCQAD